MKNVRTAVALYCCPHTVIGLKNEKAGISFLYIGIPAFSQTLKSMPRF